MRSEALAKRYAIAVFSLASERGSTEKIGADLRAAASAVNGDETVRRFYTAPVVQRDEKSAVVLKAFEGKVDEVVLHTLLLLVKKKRESYLGDISAAYDAMLTASLGREPLKVVTARPLTPGDLKKIVARISEKYGKTFEVQHKVDPSLLAGIRITMGDRYIDGSLSGKIQELARELFAIN
jgi:F-type H+-transporting ATPase subunit delta